MIQNLPPSVVLNSKKTKLQGGKGANATGKAVSTYVSPSASSTSFIVGSNNNAIGGPQVKMNFTGQLGRDSKGSDHGKYSKHGAQVAFPGGAQYFNPNNYNSVPEPQNSQPGGQYGGTSG